MVVRYWYRATCFGKPIAPWRDQIREARQDLQDADLGSYDEDRYFFVTVPGGLDQRSAWVEWEDRAA